MNIRLKITLLFTLLVMGILSLISYFVYYFTEQSREAIFRQRLLAGANNRANLWALLGDNRKDILQKVDSSSTVLMIRRAILIYDSSNQLAYQFYGTGARPFTASPAMLEAVRNNKTSFTQAGELDVAGIYHQYRDQRLVVFYMGTDEDGKKRVEDLASLLLYSLLAGVIITIIVGYLFSTQLVRPLNRLIREVNDISINNLSDRIYAGGGQDELSRLAITFNSLLDRLQESISIQKRFISNASHELSTPLTSISSQLQVTLNKDRSGSEYQAVLYSIQEDVEQMRQLTKSLLEIAKTGYEGGGIELNEVRIDELMLKIVPDVKKINPAYNVELEFGEFPEDDKSCLTYGNSDLLYSAIKNLTENACKYSHDKQAFLYLEFSTNEIIIRFKNYGDVISLSEIDRIFHPFYRGSTAGETRGFGLGLALSQRIVSLHKGRLSVMSDEKNGTVFTLTLPSLTTYYRGV
ncbi:MAG: HAMP domain-containing histidine kinase [Bacteroidota bacterium]|nr:HAMP domain-containing histidine kinase [Bacteroidota bacterium]